MVSNCQGELIFPGPLASHLYSPVSAAIVNNQNLDFVHTLNLARHICQGHWQMYFLIKTRDLDNKFHLIYQFISGERKLFQRALAVFPTYFS
jgi:hypothetical protein